MSVVADELDVLFHLLPFVLRKPVGVILPQRGYPSNQLPIWGASKILGEPGATHFQRASQSAKICTRKCDSQVKSRF